MQKKRLFGIEWSLLPVIFALAWPTMLEQLMQTAVQYIDTAMVGSLGTQATAAVGATTTVNWLIGSTVSALGVGLLSFVARAYGAGDRKLASRVASQAVLAVLVSGSFFTVLTLALSRQVPIWMQVDPTIQDIAARYFFILYLPMLPRAASIIFGTVLRAVGDTKTPMRVGILVNLVNVVLNFLMIYPTRTISLFGLSVWMPGCGWGVLGAAIASAVAFTVGGVCMTVAVWRHPVVSPKGQRLRPDREVLLPCLRVALPNMLQRFGTSLGYVAFAAMINSLGEISTAAHTIANTVESAFYIPGFGMQTAAATLAGNALGARDEKRIRDLRSTVILIELVLMTASGALLFAFAPQMMRIFSQNDDVIRLGSVVLRMVAVSEPFYGVSIVLEGMMQGVGKTVTPFVVNILGMWGVRIVGTFLMTQIFSFGLAGAWACMIAHNLLLFAVFSVINASRRWSPLHRAFLDLK
ncbi:MAG: MATE family efflux transporter [Ruminococcaceae bacterium]|nr:MATE family efflux transporter [Oscillospiraceae bacterium]